MNLLQNEVCHIFIDKVPDMTLQQSNRLDECFHRSFLQAEVKSCFWLALVDLRTLFTILSGNLRNLHIMFFSAVSKKSVFLQQFWIAGSLVLFLNSIQLIQCLVHDPIRSLLKELSQLVYGMVPIIFIVRK